MASSYFLFFLIVYIKVYVYIGQCLIAKLWISIIVMYSFNNHSMTAFNFYQLTMRLSSLKLPY